MRIIIVSLSVLFLSAVTVIRILLNKIEFWKRKITIFVHHFWGHKVAYEISDEDR